MDYNWTAMQPWRLLSNHGRVLVFIGRKPKSRLRDIAEAVDLTERSVYRIVSELCEAGFLRKMQNGRTNHYEIQPDVPVRDPLLGDYAIGEILAVVAGSDASREDRPSRPYGGPERRGCRPGDEEEGPRQDAP